MMKSYFEEFERRYNRPKMDRITVGFSGIDPAPKNSENLVTSETVQEIAEEAIEEVFQTVSLDCGEITLDSGEIV